MLAEGGESGERLFPLLNLPRAMQSVASWGWYNVVSDRVRLASSDHFPVGTEPTTPPSKQVKGERSESGNGLSEAREYKERPFTAQSSSDRKT